MRARYYIKIHGVHCRTICSLFAHCLVSVTCCSLKNILLTKYIYYIGNIYEIEERGDTEQQPYGHRRHPEF